MNEILFEVLTPLGFSVLVGSARWELIITVKHPVMQGQEAEVQGTLSEPDEIRRSRKDPNVYLFYRRQQPSRWTCVVVKRINNESFLITTYLTDVIKEGEKIWNK
jgi:hypothetical protein